MSIQIKLDAQAVASLFPEGSEIRLELQQSVKAAGQALEQAYPMGYRSGDGP